MRDNNVGVPLTYCESIVSTLKNCDLIVNENNIRANFYRVKRKVLSMLSSAALELQNSAARVVLRSVNCFANPRLKDSSKGSYKHLEIGTFWKEIRSHPFNTIDFICIAGG